MHECFPNEMKYDKERRKKVRTDECIYGKKYRGHEKRSHGGLTIARAYR